MAVLLERKPTEVQSPERPAMSTKTRTQSAEGIITAHVTLNMSIFTVCDLGTVFGVVCARRSQQSTAVNHNYGFIFVSRGQRFDLL